jgi:hypothetical protein
LWRVFIGRLITTGRIRKSTDYARVNGKIVIHLNRSETIRYPHMGGSLERIAKYLGRPVQPMDLTLIVFMVAYLVTFGLGAWVLFHSGCAK